MAKDPHKTELEQRKNKGKGIKVGRKKISVCV